MDNRWVTNEWMKSGFTRLGPEFNSIVGLFGPGNTEAQHGSKYCCRTEDGAIPRDKRPRSAATRSPPRLEGPGRRKLYPSDSGGREKEEGQETKIKIRGVRSTLLTGICFARASCPVDLEYIDRPSISTG